MYCNRFDTVVIFPYIELSVSTTCDTLPIFQKLAGSHVNHLTSIPEDSALFIKSIVPKPEVDMFNANCNEGLAYWTKSAVEDLIRASFVGEFAGPTVPIPDFDHMVVIFSGRD